MEKHDAFFIVLYGTFFAVILTFIISFDGTNGFGGTNKLTTIITVENSQIKDNEHHGKVPKAPKTLSLTKWDGGEGDEKKSMAGV